MADTPETTIISIYDLLLERKVFRGGKGAVGVQEKNKSENEPIQYKSKAISKSISAYLNCSSDGDDEPSKPSKVSATHLTKKRTGVVMQQQSTTTKKAVPQKMASKTRRGTTNSSASSGVENSLDVTPSKSLTSTRHKKKKMPLPQLSPTKSKLIDRTADQRMPMSPRKAGGEIKARVKTTATKTNLNTSKTSKSKMCLKCLKSKVSVISTVKTPTTRSATRWRI